MSEADAIAISTRGPVTRKWLADDLRSIGVQNGLLLMVHSSLSSLGWVIGGAQTVIDALRDCVGESGTLVMPGYTRNITEPGYWQCPPVPEEWWETIRQQAPPFNPQTALTQGMGVVPICFQLQPGTLRSSNPVAGWLAQGSVAADCTATHSLSMSQGMETPMGYCYQNDGWVISLATPRTTILHLAESMVEYPNKEFRHTGTALMINGQRKWIQYDNLEGDNEDFELIRLAFMREYPGRADLWQEQTVAYGKSRLFRVKPLVDFAVKWIAANR